MLSLDFESSGCHNKKVIKNLNRLKNIEVTQQLELIEYEELNKYLSNQYLHRVAGDICTPVTR